jgi:transcriptional regulator with XRE-family HTH domain
LNDDWIYEWIGKRIKWLREEAGLNQEDVARRVDLTRTSITNIEKGKQKIQLGTLYEIAKILNTDPRTLLPALPQKRIIPDKFWQPLTKLERLWVEEIISSQVMVNEEAEPKPKIKLGGDIEDNLFEIFSNVKVVTPPVGIEGIAQNCGVTVQYAPTKSAISGLLMNDNGRVVIGVNSSHMAERQRFTIAHELGHLALHETNDFRLERNFTGEVKKPSGTAVAAPAEKEANEFAYRLLMPISMLADDLRNKPVDIEDSEKMRFLAERYKVSLPAVTYRLWLLSEQRV